MNIESMVRDALHSHADGAPPSAGLVGAARARAGRRRARRALVGATAGAMVGLLALAIPYGLPGWGRGPDVPGSGPPSVPLVPAAFELPSFPFTPGWTPAGIGSPYVSLSSWATAIADGTVTYGASGSTETEVDHRMSFPQMTLAHPARPGEINSPLQVEIYVADPERPIYGHDGEPTTVHGQPGSRYMSEEGNVSIVWEHEPDLWVRVWAAADIAPEDVERYAQELEETPQPGQAPVSFELLPEDLEVASLGADEIGFRGPGESWLQVTVMWDEEVVGSVDYSPPPSGDPVDPNASSSPVDPTPSGEPVDPTASGDPVDPSASSGSVDSGEDVYASEPPPVSSRTEVGGRPAEVLEWAESTSVDIQLDEQPWILSVSGSLNREDLLSVAEGIELEPWARPFGQPAR